MKILVSILLIALTLNTEAKTTVLYAESAHDVMEALASAGLKVNNLDQDWTDVTLNIKTKNIVCVKSKTTFPDDWASATICHADNGTELKYPITLMKTLKPYASTKSNHEEDLLEVKSAECYLTTPKDPDEWKTYMCAIVTSEE